MIRFVCIHFDTGLEIEIKIVGWGAVSDIYSQ